MNYLRFQHLSKWYIINSRPSRKFLHEVNNSRCYLSSGQVTTALRPFYFLVHPDLFGQHPRAQHINDASLKLLNGHLNSLINDQKPKPLSLKFYIKNKTIQGSLNTVALQLNKDSARATVHGILSEFDLPTKYVDSLPEKSNQPDRKIDWHQSFYDATGTLNPEDELYMARRRENLYSWLIKNMGEAERRLAVSEPIRQDIVRLRLWLMEELSLHQLSWQRGLGTTHLRGCLQGLTALTTHHKEIKQVLKGRTIHFGNETGVSLEGIVVLSTSEVRNQWLKVICKLPEQDPMIQRIPDMQKAVSNTLRDIQVTHRKYQPLVLVEDYIQYLKRLVTALGDYKGRNGFPKSWPESLSSLQLVVESVRDREKESYKKCKEKLGLEFLDKDDSVMPDMMIECLERMLDRAYRLSPLLSGTRLWITHYYSIMLDGEVCIPWNWDQEKL
ncbi:T-cell activation inhibitor, mitochondrial-like isoform X2 [Panulirus ornatus]|uniref:T-cell activation inhibitor, mitochondrial-like isoform X2 n=1 Tax=Panulirus ornatus TaxID=150431 RepID=UPI003A83816A